MVVKIPTLVVRCWKVFWAAVILHVMARTLAVILHTMALAVLCWMPLWEEVSSKRRLSSLSRVFA